jgi:hypothetical protein
MPTPRFSHFTQVFGMNYGLSGILKMKAEGKTCGLYTKTRIMKTKTRIYTYTIMALFMVACSKEDGISTPEPINEPEPKEKPEQKSSAKEITGFAFRSVNNFPSTYQRNWNWQG